MKIAFSVEQIQKLSEAEAVEGNFAGVISSIAALKEAAAGDLSFLGNKKYTPDVKVSQASVILIPTDFEGAPQDGQCFVRVNNPSWALARICAAIEAEMWPRPAPGIHPSAVVDASAEIDPTAYIGPTCVVEAGAKIGAGAWLQAQAYIGRDVVVGEKSWLHPHVSIYAGSVLGDRVLLHSGVVIGADGFGYESQTGVHEKVPQIGNVVIENDVEIGSNSTVDRARFDCTRICEGAKIDNLVQIGHNCQIGPHCLLVSQVGVSGSTILDHHVVLAGQAGIAGHLKLAAGTVIGAQGGLHFDTEPGKYYRGTPALESSLANKIHVLSKRLPDLFKRVKQLEDSLVSSN
ncbi:UDP-3-O-(3-hydroxymyristoyl)glucosamine N-acyltransferase [Cerasicoccus maritimus]|uniref:UDP-3-O-(3-hydroxymyristoyl)glucosamine N-acyltransferase n=1 Tax=Cerasicoccus maritimus TaxID=490089 RepID=UPI002852C0AC|nr:UDP-3-O-(3-hydroxymyristoyl)glucosamine N-acyltransferase [Cerasicoccus maritimus]